MGKGHRRVWRDGVVFPRRTGSALVAWVLVVLLSSCELAHGRCDSLQQPSAASKVLYMTHDKKFYCHDEVSPECLLLPTYTDPSQAGNRIYDCDDFPYFRTDEHAGCRPPTAPKDLNATITYWSENITNILVQWSFPEVLCPLTGYHVSIWRGEAFQPGRGDPCLCFNLPRDTNNLLLSSTDSPCMNDCFRFDRTFGTNVILGIEVKSLPESSSPSLWQVAHQEIILPDCQQLDPLPDWCRMFPPMPPVVEVTDLRNGSVAVEWTEPFSDPLINITGYKVEWFLLDPVAVSQEREFPPHVRTFVTEPDLLEFNATYVFFVTAKSTSTRKRYDGHTPGQSDRSREKFVKIKGVNGGWTKFSDWTQCKFCDHGYYTYRHRNCSNPAPRLRGLPCKGKAEQKMPCNMTRECRVRVDDDTHAPETKGHVPFYQKMTFFIALCIGMGCILIIVTFLAIVYRYYKPKARKMEAASESSKHQLYDAAGSTNSRYNPETVSLPDNVLRPSYPERLPSAGESSPFSYSPSLNRRGDCHKTTVYISYSRRHDEQESIFRFCEWLYSFDVNVVIDRWHQNEVAEDIAGWIQHKIATSDYIISICSASYTQAWVQSSRHSSSADDLRSILSEDFESDHKRQHLEIMLINALLMQNGCRNSICIPVILAGLQAEPVSSQRVPNALSNSKVYRIADLTCQDATELLHRLYRVEQYQQPKGFPSCRWSDSTSMAPLQATECSSLSSTTTTQSTVSTTSADTNYADNAAEICPEVEEVQR